MLTAAATTVGNFFARPGAVEAIQAGDRNTALAIAAQPDPEAFAPLVDELLSIEAQRDQHRARAQQLPQVKKQFAAVQQKIADEWQAEQARRAEFDRAAAVRLDERANLERQQGKLEMSARWLLQNIDPATQSQLDTLNTERSRLAETVEFQTETERQARSAIRSCERQLESAERDLEKHPRDAAHIAERNRWQAAIERATLNADAHLRTLNGTRSELGAVTLQIDTILADVKAGKR